jgi:hypothetical protein
MSPLLEFLKVKIITEKVFRTFSLAHHFKGMILIDLKQTSVFCVIKTILIQNTYRVIRLRCQKSKTIYTRNYAIVLLFNSTYMCRRVWSLCLSTLALNVSTIAHAAQIKSQIPIEPGGTQHFWSDLLKGRCNLPP